MRRPNSIEVKKIILNDIPCLLIRPTCFNGKLPTLFHYHGWSSKKERHQFFATTIAQYGYQIILPDSNYHGDRNPISKYTFDELKEYFPKIIVQSVKEFDGIRKEAEEMYQVDKNRIAVSGNSMGGFIASSIFARNQNIKVLVCLNGASAWEKAIMMVEETEGLKKKHNIYRGRALAGRTCGGL